MFFALSPWKMELPSAEMEVKTKTGTGFGEQQGKQKFVGSRFSLRCPLVILVKVLVKPSIYERGPGSRQH